MFVNQVSIVSEKASPNPGAFNERDFSFGLPLQIGSFGHSIYTTDGGTPAAPTELYGTMYNVL
jgi:hypothetical protein